MLGPFCIRNQKGGLQKLEARLHKAPAFVGYAKQQTEAALGARLRDTRNGAARLLASYFGIGS